MLDLNGNEFWVLLHRTGDTVTEVLTVPSWFVFQFIWTPNSDLID